MEMLLFDRAKVFIRYSIGRAHWGLRNLRSLLEFAFASSLLILSFGAAAQTAVVACRCRSRNPLPCLPP